MAHVSSGKVDQMPVWLDCDPGHDDAFAILLAAHHPALNLLGISTVHGNASLEQTTANAGSVLTAIGRQDVPIYPGAAKPLSRKAVHAPDIHGDSGIDGTDLLPKPASAPIHDTSSTEAIHAALLAQPGDSAWLVATGALTNVALLFTEYPELARHISGLSIMGGAIGNGFSAAPMGHVRGEGIRFGNITRWAEFNIYCDPEAAQSIFSNPILAVKTVLIPLDLTHQVLATQEIQRQLLKVSSSGTKDSPLTLRQMLHDLLTFFAHTYSDVFGLTAGPPLHDPVAVALLLFDQGKEDLRFDDRGAERWHVEVVTEGLHSDSEQERGQVGRTIATKVTGSGCGVRIPRSLDVQRFWAVVEQCVQRAESRLASQVHVE